VLSGRLTAFRRVTVGLTRAVPAVWALEAACRSGSRFRPGWLERRSISGSSGSIRNHKSIPVRLTSSTAATRAAD
jgi:hypothetical protein